MKFVQVYLLMISGSRISIILKVLKPLSEEVVNILLVQYHIINPYLVRNYVQGQFFLKRNKPYSG